MSPRGRPPLLTVITATYNSAHTLVLALQSLLAQDFRGFEAWVVGDGCTDASEAVVRSLQDRRLNWLNLEENSGSQSAPNNEGLRRARGRYVAYLGHDDLWFPWHLSALARGAEESGASMVHSLAARMGPDGPLSVYGPPPPGRCYARHYVPPTTWLHHREVVAECGAWRSPDELRWAIDVDFSRRLHLAGKEIGFVPRLTALKFPSALFRAYSREGSPPQEPYWREMREDPASLHEAVLARLALHGREGAARDPGRRLRRLLFQIVDPYGDYPAPLDALMRALYQWSLRRRRRRRGLSGG